MLRFMKFLLGLSLVVAPAYGDSLFLNSLKDQLLNMGLLNMPKAHIINLGEIVKKSADSTLGKTQRGEISIAPGRKSLLLEMAKDPRQLVKDLPRIPTIQIGPRMILAAAYKGKTAEQRFVLTQKILTQYISKVRPELVDLKKPGYIGPFRVEEIIYGIVQGFSALALELAHEHPILKSGEWAAIAQSATQYAAFALETSKEPTLSASFTSERNLVNLADSQKRGPKLVTQTILFFDLSHGEVSFFYSYSFDGEGSARILPVLP